MCLVYDDDFQGGALDETKWNYEIALDGFGTGSFDWTTNDPTNVYTDEKGLHIVPTLTNETTSITTDQMYNGYTLNLTTDGTCTETSATSCSVHSNSTSGAMINPVRSARINTRRKVGIQYGRVEVKAKLPKGDWLWPAIWMMPTDSVYGEWPSTFSDRCHRDSKLMRRNREWRNGYHGGTRKRCWLSWRVSIIPQLCHVQLLPILTFSAVAMFSTQRSTGVSPPHMMPTGRPRKFAPCAEVISAKDTTRMASSGTASISTHTGEVV